VLELGASRLAAGQENRMTMALQPTMNGCDELRGQTLNNARRRMAAQIHLAAQQDRFSLRLAGRHIEEAEGGNL
jgi:hypothetical protein